MSKHSHWWLKLRTETDRTTNRRRCGRCRLSPMCQFPFWILYIFTHLSRAAVAVKSRIKSITMPTHAHFYFTSNYLLHSMPERERERDFMNWWRKATKQIRKNVRKFSAFCPPLACGGGGGDDDCTLWLRHLQKGIVVNWHRPKKAIHFFFGSWFRGHIETFSNRIVCPPFLTPHAQKPIAQYLRSIWSRVGSKSWSQFVVLCARQLFWFSCRNPRQHLTECSSRAVHYPISFVLFTFDH